MQLVAAILDTAALIHSDLHGQPRGIQVQSSHSHLLQGRPPPNLTKTTLTFHWLLSEFILPQFVAPKNLIPFCLAISLKLIFLILFRCYVNPKS